jgi:hypothetical protein
MQTTHTQELQQNSDKCQRNVRTLVAVSQWTWQRQVNVFCDEWGGHVHLLRTFSDRWYKLRHHLRVQRLLVTLHMYLFLISLVKIDLFYVNSFSFHPCYKNEVQCEEHERKIRNSNIILHNLQGMWSSSSKSTNSPSFKRRQCITLFLTSFLNDEFVFVILQHYDCVHRYVTFTYLWCVRSQIQTKWKKNVIHLCISN